MRSIRKSLERKSAVLDTADDGVTWYCRALGSTGSAEPLGAG